MRGRRSAAALGPCLAAWAACALAGAAHAATFEVTTTANAGAGSLRQAIDDANASADMDNTIAFMLAENSSITLTSPLPMPTQDVTLDAQGAPGLTIRGNPDTLNFLAVDGANMNLIDVNAEMGTITIGNGDTLRFTTDDDVEVSADLSDVDMAVAPGTVLKSGAATLTLSGMNDGFTGNLNIQTGTVVGDTTSLPGAAAGTGSITNSGALVFEQPMDGEYFGVISGSGTVEKRGDGDLTLSGNNTYAGGTAINAGRIIGNTDSLTGDFAIANGAGLVFDQPGNGSFAGDISGAGAVTKLDAGELTLSGASSYTGGTDVQEGTLIGTSGSIPGDVALGMDTTVVFDQDTDGTTNGSITGTGGLMKRGTGSLSLTGNNSYTNGTTVEAGTLIVDTDSLPGDATVMDMSTLVFDQSGDGTYADELTGGGAIEKRGAGVLTLDEVQGHTGEFRIVGGTLALATTGVLQSPDVLVGASGTLAGSGLASGDAVVQGTVTPGIGSADTLTVGGAVDFAAGSRFVVDVNDVGGGDRLNAGATTIAAGSTLDIDPAPGDYTLGSTAVVLDATTLTGQFDPVDDFLFLDVDVVHDAVASQVRVTLTSNGEDVTTIGETPNQRAVGAALGTQQLNPDLDEFFDNLMTLELDEGGPALDSLSGEPISAFTTSRLATAEHFQRMLLRRMRATLFASDKSWPPRSSTGPPSRRPAGPTDVAAPRLPEDPRFGVWIEGHGSLGDLDGDDNAAGVDYDGIGGALGFDARVGDHFLAGLAAGYERTEIDLDRDGDGNADTIQGAVYGSWASRRIFAGASGRYGWSQSESRRRIRVGDLTPEARGDFDSHDFGARAEVAVNAIELGEARFEPLAGIEWNHLSREDFAETGAGSLGLDVDSEELDSTVLQLGARVRTLFGIGDDAVLAPELRAYWLHEFGDRERRVEAAIAGAPFVVEGAEAPADSYLFGAGWSVSLWRNVRATADYDLRLDTDRTEHVGSISVLVRF